MLSGMAGAIPSVAKVVGGNIANAVSGQYRDIDPNSPEFALTAASSAQARGAEDAIQSMTPETNPNLYAAKPLLSIMRGGTVSAAQNLLFMALGGGPAAGRAAMNTVLGGMALSSAGQTGYETLKEGGSAGKALADAVVSAAIETGTEEIGMERWFKVLNEFDPKLVGNSLRQMVRQLPAQMFTEGLEEIAGNELEQAWDMLSEGDRSEYANRIRTLEADGMSRADAAREAAFELHALRDIRAFEEAAFSTLLMDGVPATVSSFREGKTFAAVGQDIRANGGERAAKATIQKGLAFDADSPARQAAEALQKKKAVSDKDLGRQSFLNADALYNVMRRIDERGDATATAKLREVRERLDDNIFDKVALSDLRQLVEFSKQNLIQTYKEWQALHQGSGAAIANETLSAMAANNFAPPAPAAQKTAPAVQTADAETDLPFTISDGYNPDGKVAAPEAKVRPESAAAVQADTSLFPHEILKNFNQARLYLVEYAKKNFPAFAINKETGKAIGISRKGIDKFLSGNILFEKYASGFYIPTLIENGRKTGEANNYHPETVDSIPTFEYYDSPIVIDGNEYMTHIRVKNTDMGDKYYGHTISELDNIEIESPTRTSVPTKSAVQPENTGDSTSGVTLDGGRPGQTPNTTDVSSVAPNNSITQTAAESKGETESAVDKNSESRQEKRGAETETRSAEAETDAEEFEAGLDYYDPATAEYARTLKDETRMKIDNLSRLLGKRVRFAQSVGGGIANGEISGNEIVLSRSALDDESGLVWRVLGHELTHGIQRDADSAYAAFRKAALEQSIGNAPVREHAANIRKLAEMRGVSMTEEAALDEAVADYGGELVSDTDAAERFIERNRQDRPLLVKIRDALVKLVRKLTGAEKKRVRTVQELFDAALDEAAQAVRKGEATVQKDSGVKFSLKDLTIPTYEELLKKPPVQVVDLRGQSTGRLAEEGKAFRKGLEAAEIMRRPAVNRDTGEKIYITPATFTHSFSGLGLKKLEAARKIRSVIENAVLTHRQDSRKTADHTTGIYTFFGVAQTENGIHPVKLTVKEYFNEGQDIPTSLKEALGADWETFASAYDNRVLVLDSIENETDGKSVGLTAKESAIPADPSVSMVSIAELYRLVNQDYQKYLPKRPDSDAKLSLKGTEDAERLDALIKRNQELEADVVKYCGQLAEAKTLSGARRNYDAALNLSVTKDFLKTWSSPLSPQSVAPDMMKIANLLRAGPNGDGTSKLVSQRNDQRFLAELDGMARNLAKRIIESAVEEVENPEVQTIKDFGAEVKKAQIAYGDLQAEMGKDFAPWLRRNRFRLGLRKNGRSVDSYWAGWAETYGEMFFPSDITAPADMLRHLEALLDSGVAEYANPFDMYDTLEVIEECKNSLIDALMKADEGRTAPADDRRAVRDNAFRKGVEQGRESERAKLQAEKERYAKGVRTVRDMIADERAEGERKLQRYRDRASKLREQRIETAQRNAIRRQVERLDKQLNSKNMPGGERAFLNSIFRQIEPIAKNQLGMGVDTLFRKLDLYFEMIDEGSKLYDEKFVENPFQTLDAEISMAEAANERKLSPESVHDMEKGFSRYSAEELRRVLDFLRAFDTAQKNRNALISARDSRALNEQAEILMEHVRKAKGFSVPLVENMLRPSALFRKLTGFQREETGGDPLVNAGKDLQSGERTQDDYRRRAYNAVIAKIAEGLGYGDIRTMSAEKRSDALRAVADALKTLSGKEAAKEETLIEIHGVDFTTRQPVTAYITKGMRAELYGYSLNEDAMRHIRYGGVEIPGAKPSGEGLNKRSGWEAYRKGDYRGAYAQGVQHVRLTTAQVQEIVKDLTKEEKALGAAAAWYYDKMSKPELGAVHEALKGWNPFYVENYIPLETADEYNQREYDIMRPDGSLGPIGNPAFAKERVKSGKPIVLRDLNFTLLDSIDRHARYVGLAIPFRNMSKLLNWTQTLLPDDADALRMAFNEQEAREIERRAAEIRERGEQLRKENPTLPPDKLSPVMRALYELKGEEGAERFKDASNSNSFKRSVRGAIKDAHGEKVLDYIDKLMSDLSGANRAEQDPLGKVLSALTSNYAGAVLTLNASTALVQGASYPTAAAVLGHMPLIRAAKYFPSVLAGKADLERIHVYTSRLWGRSEGCETYETEILSAQSHVLPQGVRKGGNIIQGMDVLTTTQLWKACEIYVDDENVRRRQEGVAPLEKGTPEQIAKGQSEYYRAVADVYNRVIEETQPSYGVMERPQVLRSQNALVRLTNMFKTQMYQNFNILYDAFGELGARQRDYAASQSAETEGALREARRGVGRALTSQLAAALIAVVIKSGFAIFTGDDDKYRDKEGNLTAGSYAGGVLRGTVTTIPGFVAYGSDVYSILASGVDALLKKSGADPFFRETFYGVNFPALGSLKNTVTRTESALGELLSALSGAARGLDDEKADWPGIGQKILSAVTDWTMFAGLPARNVTKLLYGFVRNAATLSMGETAGKFAVRKLLSTTLDSEIYGLLYQALADDDLEAFKDMAEDVQRNFRTGDGGRVSGKTVRDRMLSMWREETKTKGASRLGQAARDYIGAVEKYSVETPEKFTEGDLSPEAYRAYRDEADREFQTVSAALNRSAAVRAMDDKRRIGVVSNAARLAAELALERHSGGQHELDAAWMRWASGGKGYGVTPDMAILFKAAYDSAESERDPAGNVVASSKKRNAIDTAFEWMPNLTPSQLEYLQSFYWNPRNPELAALKENGYRKDAGAK